MSGLHSLAFEPQIRFVRQVDAKGHWAECAVCGESLFGADAAWLEAACAKHRELAHVVMVYPHGIPRSTRLRRARGGPAPDRGTS